MRLLFILFFTAFTALADAQQKAETRTLFSATEVREDLAYLYTNLEASHYNLYVKNPKKVFGAAFNRLQEGIRDSMNFLQVSRTFQSFVALSELGHCNTSYPFNNSYAPFVMQGGKVFPFDASIKNRRVRITRNYTTDESIEKGDEIMAIDGMPVVNKLTPIYRYLSGENEFFKNTVIDLFYFPRIWWLVYGPADSYTLKLRKPNGAIVTKQVKAIGAIEYETKASANPPLFNTNRSFRFIDSIAYLRPGQFLNAVSDGSVLSHQGLDKGEFVRFIDSAFGEIRTRQSKNLIIDLRGNPGGDNSFSDNMVAWFANKPFWYCSTFLVKTSSHTKKFWKDVNDTILADLKEKIMTHKDGEIFEAPIHPYTPHPDSLQFKGRVFVLIDRYSYSNAATTAALIQDYGFGKLIGEQTADSPTTYAAVHEFNLPHTGIAVVYPKAFMIRPNGNRSLKGVVPDYPVAEGADILEYALKVIGK